MDSRADIKPADDGDFVGTNLNQDSWVPFNDNEPSIETRVPPRPEPTTMVPQESQPQQQVQYIPQQYYEMPIAPPPNKDIMASLKETPTATLAVIFGIGAILGYMLSNRRPIIVSGH